MEYIFLDEISTSFYEIKIGLPQTSAGAKIAERIGSRQRSIYWRENFSAILMRLRKAFKQESKEDSHSGSTNLASTVPPLRERLNIEAFSLFLELK